MCSRASLGRRSALAHELPRDGDVLFDEQDRHRFGRSQQCPNLLNADNRLLLVDEPTRGSRRTSSRAWSSCIKAGSSLRATSNACLAIRRSRGVISVSWRRHEYRRAAPAHGRRPCALYFLLAAGHSLIWGLMRVLNFAHGAFSRPPLMPDCSRRRSSRAVRP